MPEKISSITVVSTHSRLKAAGHETTGDVVFLEKFQHTAA